MDHISHENGHCSNNAVEPANFSSHSTDDFKMIIHHMKKTALRHLLVTVAGLAAAFIPISVLAAPGDLYQTNFGGTIFKFAPDGTMSTFASGLSGSFGLAFDGFGNLFEADRYSNTIFKFTPAGTKSTFASGLSGPFGLAFDSAGNLFEADYGSGTIFKFTPAGTKSTFASGLNFPLGLAFDGSGNLFEADSGSNTIFKFTPAGTKSTFASSGLNQPYGLAFDSAGNLFEANFGGGTIFKFTPAGTQSTFASGLNFPAGLAFDSAGNLFEADLGSGLGSGTIFIFTPGGTKSTFASGLTPFFLAFEPTIHQLRNISTRGLVGTGDSVLIGGFIIGGNGMVNGVVLIRALGPTLTGFGVAGALQDPTLQLLDSSGGVLATNDNWRDTQQSQIQATGLAPPDDRESAIYATLPAGAYTAIVRGASNTTGVAIVEVYNVQ
jgi:DNA-binding beta-propeller fold protein YncE